MSAGLVKLNRAPLVGIAVFFIVFATQALGHTVMILMEEIFGQQYVYHSAIVIGLGGALLWYFGLTNKSETMQTWLGFLAGSFVWTGWAEFSFHYYSRVLNVAPLIENGEIVTKQEYLVMTSSIGVLGCSLLFFFLNKDTKCNFFRWFHRKFHMKVGIGKPASLKDRNFCNITAIETIYVVWFFYIFLLVVYDKNFLGDDHWAMYPILLFYVVWTAYLTARLLKFTRMSSAIRYGIPTAIIGWTAVEILGRWHLFEEFWVHPLQYGVQMAIVAIAFLSVLTVTILTPTDRTNTEPL